MGREGAWSPWRSGVAFGTAALFVFFQHPEESLPVRLRPLGAVIESPMKMNLLRSASLMKNERFRPG